jgi:hypothetical protein
MKAGDAINTLKRVTDEIVQAKYSRDKQSIHAPTLQRRIWALGPQSAMLLVYARSHVFSLFDRIEQGAFGSNLEAEIGTSLPGFSMAVGFYLHGVLDLWEGRQRLEAPLLRCTLTILKKDLDRTEADMISGDVDPNVWLWKLFTGALTLAQHNAADPGEEYLHSLTGREFTFKALRGWFNNRIRVWASVAKIEEWKDVKETLMRFSWPEVFAGESLAEEIWKEAMKGERGPHGTSGCL